MRQPVYVFMLVKEARDTILAIFFGFFRNGDRVLDLPNSDEHTIGYTTKSISVALQPPTMR